MAAAGGVSHLLCVHALGRMVLLLLHPRVQCTPLPLDSVLGYWFGPWNLSGRGKVPSCVLCLPSCPSALTRGRAQVQHSWGRLSQPRSKVPGPGEPQKHESA